MTHDPSSRHRLAAILSADAVGYSRLMSQDEDGAVRLVATLRSIVARTVPDQGGRLVDFTGDNFLAEFSSAVQAVRCALTLREAVERENASLRESERMRFRMGVHVGDVRVEGQRIFGSGVNIAARLEAFAPPGGLCVSGIVAEQVRGKLDLPLRDVGERRLKNIPDRVRVFVLAGPGDARSAATAPGRRGRRRVVLGAIAALAGLLVWLALPPPAPSPSHPPATISAPLTAVAVLPFESLGAEPDQDYFASGVSEEIINALAQAPDLQVVARTSAFALKHERRDVREIGEELGVGSIVEGSVRRAGDRVRITAQLVQARDGFHLWSESFDRRLDDVLAVQDEIAAAVREALEGEIAPPAATAPTPAIAPAAYDAYLRGRHALNVRPEGLPRALERFERCTELEPDWAPCHAALSVAEFFSWGYLPDASTAPRRIERARAEAERALALAPALAEAHVAAGNVHGFDWNWSAMIASLERAATLSPGSADVRHQLGVQLARVGRVADSRREMEIAARLDPLSPVLLREAALLHLFGGDPERAERYAQRSRELKPRDFRNSVTLARILLALDRERDSLEAYLAFFPAWQRPGGRIVGRLLGPLRASRLSARLTLATLEDRCGDAPELGAWAAAWVGDRERMYHCLGVAADHHRVPLPLADPVWEPYRAEPRFQAYLRRVRLAP